ncbi:MAG: methionyl-tRNA formyltransferase, partial [Candidatus Peregrinibacteria bacterium]
MNLIVAATGDIAVPMLKALSADKRFSIGLVITGVDRPAGRKMELTPSAIKRAAETLGLSVFQPESMNEESSIQKLKAFAPDLMLVMAYGQILSEEVLAIPRLGCVNVHASLLPRHCGASPVQSALLEGDSKTGISVMHMAKAMDAGPVYESFQVRITSDDNAITLSNQLARLAAEKVPEVLSAIVAGKGSPKPQDESRATFCKKISKADGQIVWSEPAD